jgi:hypothetical protein
MNLPTSNRPARSCHGPRSMASSNIIELTYDGMTYFIPTYSILGEAYIQGIMYGEIQLWLYKGPAYL